MKKLDVDRDGQITFPDFQNAVFKDPLLLQAIGPCLPPAKAIAAFLALVTDKYRKYTDCYGRNWVRRNSHKRSGRKHYMDSNLGASASLTSIAARKSTTPFLTGRKSISNYAKGGG